MESLLASVLSWLLSFLLVYGYPFLFAIAFIAALIIPLPASTLLVAASAFASQGHFNIWVVMLVSLSANILGDAVGYFLMRWYGARFLTRIGLGGLIGSEKFQKLEDYFRAYPKTLIFFSRFMTEANSIVNALSGLSRIPPRVFFAVEVAGQTAYVILYASIGYYLGGSWEDSISLITKGALFIVSIGIFFNVVQVLMYRARGAKSVAQEVA